jgi:hypothetical protein
MKETELKPDYSKPPLGVSPAWFVYRQRMTELNEAIGRFIEYIEQNQHIKNLSPYYKAIAQWSREIECLASLEAELEQEVRQ